MLREEQLMSKTKIPYVINNDGSPGESWNPVAGCTPVDEGCHNCWAQKYLKRFGRAQSIEYHYLLLDQPYKWEKRRTVAVCFMSDLFHKNIDIGILEQIFITITNNQKHRFLVLTKRIERAKEYFKKFPHILPNIWLGTTVIDQKSADERIPILLSIPAYHYWISYEPALGAIDFYEWMLPSIQSKIEWCVMGAESGHGARPMNIDWSRSARDRCYQAGIPFYYKQGIGDDGLWTHMPALDGQTWDQIPWGTK